MRADRNVAVVPGDDAAPEAVSATMLVLEQMELPIRWTVLEPGESLISELADASDTVLFGASSGRTRGLEHLRFGWGTFANVRPVKYIPGVASSLSRPDGVDYVIVREALEDLYTGIEGPLSRLIDADVDLTTRFEKSGAQLRYPFTAAGEGVYGLRLYTREGIERVARFAAALATQRQAQGHPGRVTIGGKWNVSPGTDGFFRDVARAAIAETPGVTCDSYLADDLGRRLVMSPEQFDVVLLPNMLGDILSDVGAGTVGGLGMAPSGSYGDGRAYFEPVHGSAPDIAGQHVINPTATLLSAVMMLDHLGLADAAERLDSAVRIVISTGECRTPDLGGTASTGEFARAVFSAC
jgi:isocitrate/isopropylmalate dehydrogenase